VGVWSLKFSNSIVGVRVTQETGTGNRQQKTDASFWNQTHLEVKRLLPETNMAVENNLEIDTTTAACFIAAANKLR